MMLAQHIKHALPMRAHKPHAPQLTFPRVMTFSLTPPKHAHTKQVCHITRVDTEHTLYRIHRSHTGFKILDSQTSDLLYKALIDTTLNVVRIVDAKSEHVVMTTRQKGHLFPITQVFAGENTAAEPSMEVCAALDYALCERQTGRVLACVDRKVRYAQPALCNVCVDTGLNVPLLLLLITTINNVAEL